MQSRRNAKHFYVSIVSGNPETLESLRAYLEHVGIPSHGTKAVLDDDMIAPATTAVVLFPDDFDIKDVESRLLTLRRDRPRVLVIVVTREPTKFKAVLAADGRSILPIVLPRPSFGWTIVDVIRDHDDAAAP
jgi:hypothetical protein